MTNADRRQFKRFPVLYHLIKPVLIRLDEMPAQLFIPAIMANLSAGGMALLTFSPLSVGKNLIVTFDLKLIKAENVRSKIVRCENKGGSYVLGIEFLNLQKEIFDKINKMADDFDSCETRILLGNKPICRVNCNYSEHCQRTAKGHYE